MGWSYSKMWAAGWLVLVMQLGGCARHKAADIAQPAPPPPPDQMVGVRVGQAYSGPAKSAVDIVGYSGARLVSLCRGQVHQIAVSHTFFSGNGIPVPDTYFATMTDHPQDQAVQMMRQLNRAMQATGWTLQPQPLSRSLAAYRYAHADGRERWSELSCEEDVLAGRVCVVALSTLNPFPCTEGL